MFQNKTCSFGVLKIESIQRFGSYRGLQLTLLGGSGIDISRGQSRKESAELFLFSCLIRGSSDPLGFRASIPIHQPFLAILDASTAPIHHHFGEGYITDS